MAEPQNLLSPSVHKRNSTGSNRITVGYICPKHQKFFSNDHCPLCEKEVSVEATAVHTHDWVKSVWEHIGPEPIKIESKEHLFRECEKRGVIPRAFMKPKSTGPGFEIARR